MKPIHKFNGGKGATLCHTCHVIISVGLTDDLYCNKCNTMKKEFVPYEQALELKELDFDEPCFGWYTLEGDGAKPMFIFEQRLKQDIGLCLALTFSQAFRFFREKYDLHNGIYPYYDEYEFQIKDFRLPTNVPINGGIMKYEEAELACLKKLIEMVKNK